MYSPLISLYRKITFHKSKIENEERSFSPNNTCWIHAQQASRLLFHCRLYCAIVDAQSFILTRRFGAQRSSSSTHSTLKSFIWIFLLFLSLHYRCNALSLSMLRHAQVNKSILCGPECVCEMDDDDDAICSILYCQRRTTTVLHKTYTSSTT